MILLREGSERKPAEAVVYKAAGHQKSLRPQAIALERLATPMLPIHRDVVVMR